MPKLGCPCGYVHNLSPIPDMGWHTIPDDKYEEFQDALVSRREIAGDRIPPSSHPRISDYRKAMQIILQSQGLLYHCPECNRIMWRREGQEDFSVFVPERNAHSTANKSGDRTNT